MKAVILYRPNSEFARRAEEYVHDFERTRAQTVELIDVDSAEGIAMAKLYDLPHYPTLLITEEDGQMVKSWDGVDSFPLMNELATYLNT